MNERIALASSTAAEVSPKDNSRWCFQMVSAISHIHLVAHDFHMDIKTSNMLLDDNTDLLLIGLEQSGAPKCTIAPEADGTWDVRKAEKHGELICIDYPDRPQENLTISWPSATSLPFGGRNVQKPWRRRKCIALGERYGCCYSRYRRPSWSTVSRSLSSGLLMGSRSIGSRLWETAWIMIPIGGLDWLIWYASGKEEFIVCRGRYLW